MTDRDRGVFASAAPKPIVVIGIAADGHHDLLALAAGIPPHSSIAYLVIHDLSDHAIRALAADASVPVLAAVNGAAPPPDALTVAPAGATLALGSTRLLVRPRGTADAHAAALRLAAGLSPIVAARCAVVLLGRAAAAHGDAGAGVSAQCAALVTGAATGPPTQGHTGAGTALPAGRIPQWLAARLAGASASHRNARAAHRIESPSGGRDPVTSAPPAEDGAQHAHLVAERSAHAELRAMVEAADVAAVMVDEDLRLRRVTAAASAVLDATDTDIGRPANALDWKIDATPLMTDAAESLRSGATVEREIDAGERAWLVRARPCLTGDTPSAGCVLSFVDITARRTAELDLRENRTRLELALKAGRIGVYDFASDSPVVHWDSTMREIWGIEGDGPVFSDTALDQIHPEDRAEVEAALDRALSNPSNPDFAISYRIRNRRDDRPMWVESRGRTLFEPGRAPRLVGTLRDVTESKSTEARLLRFVEAAPVALAMFDASDRLLAASDRYDRDWRISGDSPPLRPRDWTEIRNAALRGSTTDIERQPVGADPARWVRGRVGPWRDADGTIGGYLLYYEDVSDLVRAEADLRSQSERLDLAYMAAGIGAWDWDVETDRAIWSEQMFAMLGAPPGTAPSSRAFFDFVHPDDRGTVGKAMESALADGVFESTFRVVRGDGEERVFTGLGRARRDADGRAVGMIGVNFDETERHRNEMQRALLLDELNHRVKNTLATIQSIANHTARRTSDVTSFTETFIARLDAIARAHEILIGEPDSDPTLADLVAAQVGPYADAADGGQLVTDGPEIRLDTRTGHALALVLHELTTNAAKYGALSRPGGRINLRWRRETLDAQDWLAIHWQERGGPKVAAPERRGFGSLLIQQSLSYALGGSADLDYAPDGLSASLRVKLRMSAP